MYDEIFYVFLFTYLVGGSGRRGGADSGIGVFHYSCDIHYVASVYLLLRR